MNNYFRSDFRFANFVVNNDSREGIDTVSLGRFAALPFDLGSVKLAPFLRPFVSSKDYQFQFFQFPARAGLLMKQAVTPTRVIAFFAFRTRPIQLSGRTTFRIQEAMRTRRSNGYIVHVGQSRSAGFWVVIKAKDDGRIHFAYGRSFMSYPNVPKVGHEVEFTRLPPADRGDLDRAIEVAIIKCRKGGRIEVDHADGGTKVILRSGKASKVIGVLAL